MRRRFKVILRLISVLIVILVVTLISSEFSKPSHAIEYKEIDNINNFGYSLEERDTLLMQKNFSEIKKVLDKEEIDYDKYAEYLSKLFIIDLFTIANKNNKYDVGSMEYIYPEVLENYKLNVEDTIYKYVESDKKDEYPIVKSVNLESIEEVKYNLGETEYDAYKSILTWDYEKDLGYPKKGEIILIKNDTKLFVVSFKGVD